jgi:hypothetical protein
MHNITQGDVVCFMVVPAHLHIGWILPLQLLHRKTIRMNDNNTEQAHQSKTATDRLGEVGCELHAYDILNCDKANFRN